MNTGRLTRSRSTPPASCSATIVQVLGAHTLLVQNGTVNFGGNTVFGEAIGALSGTSSSWGGAGAMLLEGGSVATSTPNYSGALYNTWTQLDGGTQEFSGAATNQSGPTAVNGGLLILNKTPGTNVYAISGAGDSYSGYATMGAMLQINGGTVQLLQANQIDPAVPITIDGGTLLLTGNSQISTTPLTLVANSNNVGLVSAIDFGTTNPSVTNTVLEFADSHNAGWSGSTQVKNWIGNLAGGGQDQFIVGTSADLPAGYLSALKFVNADGTVGTSVSAVQLASGEIVPSALPSMWADAGGGSWNTARPTGPPARAPNGTHAVANFVGQPFPVGITGAAAVTLDGSQDRRPVELQHHQLREHQPRQRWLVDDQRLGRSQRRGPDHLRAAWQPCHQRPGELRLRPDREPEQHRGPGIGQHPDRHRRDQRDRRWHAEPGLRPC